MKSVSRLLLLLQMFVAGLLITGCVGERQGIQQARTASAARIQSEAPGDYFVARRYYKPQFKFWGYIRRPGQPWSTSQLVMLNEKQKLAPDRQVDKLGSDNNFEYKFYGSISSDKVYEPASNGFYPEFVLQNYELISTNPPPIFTSQIAGGATTSTGLRIEKPE